MSVMSWNLIGLDLLHEYCTVKVEYSDMSVMSWNLTGLDLICGMKNHTNSTHVIHGVQVSGIVFYVLVLIL
jgi:hypothetical protein